MLLNDFYYCNIRQHQPDIQAELTLNPDHPIFEGHFPDQPIVPGVCMLQMVKEILEQALDRSLKLVGASNIKFIAFIDPTKQSDIRMSCTHQETEGDIQVIASLSGENQIFFKFRGRFR